MSAFYKFLKRRDERLIGPFSGREWPTTDDRWQRVDEPLTLCRQGLHLCRAEHLPHWLADELWTVEVDGDVCDEPDQIVATRARLAARVHGWPEVAPAFAQSCVDAVREHVAYALECDADGEGAGELRAAASGDLAHRAQALVDGSNASAVVRRLAGYLSDSIEFAGAGDAKVVAYVAAHAADRAIPRTRLSRGASLFDQERARQAAWLARELSLPAP